MVNELLIRYSEDLRENKIAVEIYETLRDQGIEPLEVNSNYFTKIGIFTVKYSFSKRDHPKLSLLEEILKNAGFLERIEIINNQE